MGDSLAWVMQAGKACAVPYHRKIVAKHPRAPRPPGQGGWKISKKLKRDVPAPGLSNLGVLVARQGALGRGDEGPQGVA